MTDKLITKIHKLLALADISKSGTTPEEAANAAAKVQELIQTYNLDQSMLHLEAPRHRMKVCQIGLPTSRLWVKNLLATLCQYHFCKALWYVRTPQAYILGEEVNIEAVLALFNHLGEALKIMAAAYYITYSKRCQWQRKKPVAPQSYKANFYEGAINAITYRLDEQQREFAAQSAKRVVVDGKEINASQALIVSNRDELEAFQEEKFPDTRQVHLNTRDIDAAGYRSGIQAGMEVELHKLVKER